MKSTCRMFNLLHKKSRPHLLPVRYLAVKTLKNVETENNLDQKQYTDFKKFLKSKNISYKDGYTQLQCECRLCNQTGAGAGAGGRLAYVNKRTGAFLCPDCDIKRPLSIAFEMYEKGWHLNAKEATSGDDLQYNAKFSNLIDVVPQDVCNTLNIKGLKVSDLASINVKYSAENHTLHFPLRNATNKVVGEQILNIKDSSEETFQRPNQSGILIHGPQNKQKAIVVTNLLDFITLTILNLESHCIVCLPYSLKSLPQECLPALERFKELVFWFNFDSSGWDTARTFAQKMDEKRCLLIRPTDTEPPPVIAHRKRSNLRHILEKALPVRHKSITTFSALRNDVLSELQNIEKVNGIKWKRFPILNKLLKGHRRGELTIITGPTGSGKTTFMSEYSLDLALQGVVTLWGSFEIRNSRLASTLLRQFVGYSLEKKLNEFDHWANLFEKYPLYFMTFHGQQPLKVVMEAIEHAQYIHDINHVIIDNLQFMMGISTTYKMDKFWEQDAIIAAFRSFATKQNVHVTLVMHPRKERDEEDLTTSSIFGSAKATQEADNVLIIQDKRLTSLKGKKYLQIVKNRYSGDLGIMPMEFDKEALSYALNRKKKETKTKDKDKESEKATIENSIDSSIIKSNEL